MRIQKNVGNGEMQRKRDTIQKMLGRNRKNQEKAAKREKGNTISQKSLGTLSFCKDYGK
jgi:hypothetical protein